MGLGCERPSTPDGGPAPDAGPPAVAPSVVATDAGPADPASALRATVAALRALLDQDELPTEFDPQSLFAVDLEDESAIAARIAQLRGAPPPTDAGPPEPVADAGWPEGGPPDAAVDASAPEDGGAPDAGARDAVPPDAGPPPSSMDAGAIGAPDAGGLDAGGLDAGFDATLEGELERLRAERDALRLRFLERTREERETTLTAVRARRRIALEESASRAQEEAAREEARLATVARDQALSQAAASPSVIERDLLAEQARVQTARAELARWLATRAEQRQGEARASAERLRRIHALELHRAAMTPEEADAAYDAAVAHLTSERTRFEEAIEALGASDDEAPELELELDLDSAPYASAPGRAALAQSFARFQQARARAVEEEEEVRWAHAELLASDLRAIDALRVSLLPHLGDAHRDEVLGLGELGRGELGRELQQARLLFTYWARRAWHDVPKLPRRFGSLFLRSRSRTDLLWTAAWVVFVVVLWRQREAVTERLRAWVHEHTAEREWRRLLRPLWAVFGPLLVPLALIGALHVLLWLLDDLSDSLAIDALRVVALNVAWFSFLTIAVSGVFVSRLRHGAARASVARRILASVRMVLGFGLVVVLITDLGELLFGRGYVYEVVVDLAWFGVVPIAAILIHRWADDVCEVHRERHPEGFVARSLARGDSGLRRRLLTAAAALQLAIAGTYSALKDLALRFEQSRRAFAFLFRRRLERRTEGKVNEAELRELPQALRDAFHETPAAPEIAIDHYPGLDALVARIAERKQRSVGLTVALVGERGIGKTTWMQELVRRADLDAAILDVPHRLIDPASLCAWLAQALELAPSATVEELAAQLGAGEGQRVILLDNCQNLVVRAIGGTVALEALLELASHTAERVIWVCSFARNTWLYLERHRQGQDLFAQQVSLERWSEAEIAALVKKRMDAAGMQASFRDLVVDQLKGSALEDAVLRTQGEYIRLLWDFAEGNPRIAIHYWLHSLMERDGELRVRLFAAPDVEDLDKLHEESRFLLATIALHENATVEEAATSLGSSIRQCSALLSYLRSLHYVGRDPQGQWRITTHWYRGVIRYLRRRRLLFD